MQATGDLKASALPRVPHERPRLYSDEWTRSQTRSSSPDTGWRRAPIDRDRSSRSSSAAIRRASSAWYYRLTGDRTQAVDLAQDVFVKAYASLDTFRADAKFTTWLYIIARNHWRDSLRARRSRAREAPGSRDVRRGTVRRERRARGDRGEGRPGGRPPPDGRGAQRDREARDDAPLRARHAARRDHGHARADQHQRRQGVHRKRPTKVEHSGDSDGRAKSDQRAAAGSGVPVDRAAWPVRGRRAHARGAAPRGAAHRRVPELPGRTGSPASVCDARGSGRRGEGGPVGRRGASAPRAGDLRWRLAEGLVRFVDGCGSDGCGRRSRWQLFC